MRTDYVSQYLIWLKENMSTRLINEEVTEITSPFLDRHNDHIQIYIHEKASSMVLSDAGYILGDLQACGFSFDSPTRKQRLNVILNGYGVKIGNNDELFVEANTSDFPQKKHALIQSVLAVNDMFCMNRSSVMSLFIEDCQNYFESHNIIYNEQISVPGKSGLYHKYDFLLPKSKKNPFERFVKPVNNFNKQNVESVIFAWTDTKPERNNDNSRLFVIANDQERALQPRYIDALNAYDITTMPFTNLDTYIDQLAS